MRRGFWLAPLFLLMAPETQAAPDNIQDDAFKLVIASTVQAPPAAVYRMIGQPRLWWNPAHSYSGDARALSLDLRAGGCFCETMPRGKGSVEHGRVLQAMPGKLIRLSAALGPLQELAVTGTMTWTITPNSGGRSSSVMLVYRVSGDLGGQGKVWAPAVDAMLSEQVGRLVTALEPQR